MKDSILDVIVVGAGHAGLCISYYLQQSGLKHIVFEQYKIGESWHSQRWDSFRLNTPNKLNVLPGLGNNSPDPDGFSSAGDFLKYLNEYAKKFKLPVRENSRVLSVEKPNDANLFSVVVLQNGQQKNYQSKKVVVASGSQNKKIIPGFASEIAPDVNQLHTSEYRNSESLPEGAVLVVGTAQSGVQIAEDLLETGRKVYLSTSKVARVPRRFRGRDVIDWMLLSGFMDQRTDDVTDPQMLKMKQPQVSGVGRRGKTVSLQALAKKGAVVLGKMHNADKDKAYLESNAAEHIKFADTFSDKMKDMLNEFISKAQISAPTHEEDAADIADENTVSASHQTLLNFKQHNITSIIWATGFTGDFSYLKLPVFNNDGTIKHKNGTTEIDGLYIFGFPWLRTRKSGIIPGIDDDAKFLNSQLTKAN